LTYKAIDLMGLGIESILAKYLEDNQSGGGSTILVVTNFASLPNPPLTGNGTLGYTENSGFIYIYDNTWIQLTTGPTKIVANAAALPATGGLGQLAITINTGFLYYWNGATWVRVTSGTTVEIVATFADLPTPPNGGNGTLGFTEDTNILYIYDTSWIRLTRRILTSDINLFVSTTGSDSTGDGTVGNPWATPQFAYDTVCTFYDQGSFIITINFANGIYPELLIEAGVPTGFVTFAGNSSDQKLVQIGDGNEFAGLMITVTINKIQFKDLTLNGSFWGIVLDESAAGSTVVLNDVGYGPDITYMCLSNYAEQSFLFQNGDLCVVQTTNLSGMIECIFKNTIDFFPVSLNVSAVSAFSDQCIYVDDGGYVLWDIDSLTGSPTGNKVWVINCSTLDLFNDSIALIPGNSDGKVGYDSFLTATSSAPNYSVTLTTSTNLSGILTRHAYNNLGATARVDITLPTANVNRDLIYTFVCADTDGIRIIANAGDTINIAGTVSAVAGRIDSTQIGASVTLICIDSTQWIATSALGTWTVT
jgi:hypothetical protein